ncbi:hypothetical protein Fot_10967 [Forsythia ovata]|uniref:Uncharacterized protein n=1 Tax=Forsythia ovata TaxID=205694 RepID=A0ABD1WIP4_9LAMI
MTTSKSLKDWVGMTKNIVGALVIDDEVKFGDACPRFEKIASWNEMTRSVAEMGNSGPRDGIATSNSQSVGSQNYLTGPGVQKIWRIFFGAWCIISRIVHVLEEDSVDIASMYLLGDAKLCWRTRLQKDESTDRLNVAEKLNKEPLNSKDSGTSRPVKNYNGCFICTGASSGKGVPYMEKVNVMILDEHQTDCVEELVTQVNPLLLVAE